MLSVVEMWNVSGYVTPQVMCVISPHSYAHLPSAVVLSVLSVWRWWSVAVKRHWERHRDVGWLLGGFAESGGNFPRCHLYSVVCQPPLALLAAIVPTAVNHAAYESEQQSIALLMNLNSSQSLCIGIHWHICRLQLVTWIPSGRKSWCQAEINHNKYLAANRLCLRLTENNLRADPPWIYTVAQIIIAQLQIWKADESKCKMLGI